MSQAKIRAAFPRLKRATFYVTSPSTTIYNCVAWAASDSRRWWWPSAGYYWPAGVPQRVDLAAFVALFEYLGFQRCANGDLEANNDKIALFVDAHGAPTHAARQLPNGRWTSKLGNDEDIDHTIYGLEAGAYGSVAQFMKRKTPPASP